MSLIARATLIWLGFFLLAIVNGTVRELGLKRFIDEPWAHHVSAITGIVLFGIYGWTLRRVLDLGTSTEAVWIGLYWLILTVLTETFIVGRLMGKHSWEEILANYDVSAGSLWPFVLLWVTVLPYLVWKLGGR